MNETLEDLFEDFEKKSIEKENHELKDSLKMYLQEINRRPLLSPEEEQKLAKRIKEGDHNARKMLIESNLKLVVSIAKRYVGNELSLLDLIQEGNTGLIKAVDKYDIEKEAKFSTHAAWWIRQAITKAITNQGRNIRVPSHMYIKIKAYRKTFLNLEAKLKRQPTIDEIAKEMNLSIPEVTTLYKLQYDKMYT